MNDIRVRLFKGKQLIYKLRKKNKWGIINHNYHSFDRFDLNDKYTQASLSKNDVDDMIKHYCGK